MCSTERYRVLVVSPNLRVLNVLARLLRDADGLAFAGCASSVHDALSFVAENRPDVVVSGSPPRSAEEVLLWRKIRDLGPRTMMLSTYLREDEMLLSVLSSASAHVLATAGGAGWLTESIRRVCHGESLIPAGVMTRVREQLRTGERTRLDAWGRAVLDRVLDGASDYAISLEFGATENEVRHQVTRLADKLTLSPAAR